MVKEVEYINCKAFQECTSKITNSIAVKCVIRDPLIKTSAA